MTSPEEIGCSRQRTDDVARYVAGRMPESEATEFESHYLGCDDCARELEIATAMRALAARRRPRWLWSAGAGVAAALTIALFMTMLHRDEPAMPNWRGTEETALTVTVSYDGERVTGRWQPVPAAARYRIQLFTRDGALLEQIETRGTEVVMPLNGMERGERPLLRVEAIDSGGERVSISAPVGVN